jgi:hypothetical protein
MVKNWSQLIVAIIIACLLIVTQGAGIPSIPRDPRAVEATKMVILWGNGIKWEFKPEVHGALMCLSGWW